MKAIKINKKKMKELKEVSDNKREWHEEFTKYVESIVKHKNYEGLFYERGDNNKVNWVVAGKSPKGLKRRAWWDEQCRNKEIPIEAGCYAKIALILHPTGKHVCQICGKSLKIQYVYPSKRTIVNILKEFNKKIAPFHNDIFEIIDEICNSPTDIAKFMKVLKIKDNIKLEKEVFKQYVQINLVEKNSKALSPGAMSNSPDRFDGYHSDGACCRHESDKGRHKSNLQRYGQDRRVYENWADGDWKQADRLMSEFRKHGISADHIGPISLGFCHRPKFHPLTSSENSAKNNRMSLDDVNVLINDEKSEQVVSWHSKYIWDNLKGKVKNDTDAVKLSDLMRKNMHHVLIIFSMIDEKGYADFLEQFLNPEFSFYDYTFKGFDPSTGKYAEVKSKKLTGKNQKNNVERYYRVAFDKLNEYRKVDNRKNNKWSDRSVDAKLDIMFDLLSQKKYDEAKIQLQEALKILADIASPSF